MERLALCRDASSFVLYNIHVPVTNGNTVPSLASKMRENGNTFPLLAAAMVAPVASPVVAPVVTSAVPETAQSFL